MIVNEITAERGHPWFGHRPIGRLAITGEPTACSTARRPAKMRQSWMALHERVISTPEGVVAISRAVERSDTPGLELKLKSHPGGMPASIAFAGRAHFRTCSSRT